MKKNKNYTNLCFRFNTLNELKTQSTKIISGLKHIILNIEELKQPIKVSFKELKEKIKENKNNKIYVNGLKLHENKTEIFLDYMGDFEKMGSMLICKMEQKTNLRYKNVDDFETCMNAIDVDYDSEDVIFAGWQLKLNTPEFDRVNRT